MICKPVYHTFSAASCAPRRANGLARLARKRGWGRGVRVGARDAFRALVSADADDILLALARDDALKSKLRVEAIKVLVQRDQVTGQEAINVLLTLARDDAVEASVRLQAADLLRSLDRVDEATNVFLALTRDDMLEPSVRYEAVQCPFVAKLARVLCFLSPDVCWVKVCSMVIGGVQGSVEGIRLDKTRKRSAIDVQLQDIRARIMATNIYIGF